jgi:mannose-6-phosphate isomerase-like protein (cupin superfamily)
MPGRVDRMIDAGSFVIVEWTDDGSHPGQPIAALHLHREDDEAWYVLEGRLGFRIGAAERTVEAGEMVLAPRGIPHTWWNAHAAPTRYLLIMTPRIHHLIQVLHDGSRSDYAAVFEEHASELLT